MAKKTKRKLKLDPRKDPLAAWPYADRNLYFMSGSNNPVEIEVAAARGENVGTAAPDTGLEVEKALSALADDYTQTLLDRSRLAFGRKPGMAPLVFVDSGAFSEVKFGPTGPTWPKPISNAEWRKRIAKYDRLADKLGPQLFAVAPDKVADQAGTLARQEQYAAEMQDLKRKGANLLVPVQKGGMSMVDFYTQELAALGLKPGDPAVYAAIPMKKDATSLEDLERFIKGTVDRFGLECRESATTWEAGPRAKEKRLRLHLLGRGAFSPEYEETFDIIKKACPAAIVTSDSVRIRAMVGKTRPVTQALHHAKALGVSDAKARKAIAIAATNALVDSTEYANAVAAGWYDSEVVSSPDESLSRDLSDVYQAAKAGRLDGVKARCPKGPKGKICRLRLKRTRR